MIIIPNIRLRFLKQVLEPNKPVSVPDSFGNRRLADGTAIQIEEDKDGN